MRVLLVSCYELGRQPLTLASVAGLLGAAGHHVRAADLAVESLDDAAVDWADTVAVSVPMHTAMRLAVPVVERVRRRRGAGVTVALFGLYAPLGAGSLRPGLVDHVVGGEVEEEVLRIVEGTPTGRRIVLDRLALRAPDRTVLPPPDRYATMVEGSDRRPVGHVEASRGCVHRCRHCPVPAVYQGRIRVTAVDALIEDVDRLRAMGVRHLTFGDPDFLNAPPHALRTVCAVHSRHPDLTFDVTTKIEHILEHRALWPELRDRGLRFVTSAVESTSDTVLRILDKGHRHADTLEALDVLRGQGIELRPSLLPFTPWSGLDDYIDLLDMVTEHDLEPSVDPVQLTIRLLVPDGSLLLGTPEMRPFLRGHDPERFSHLWQHPDAALDTLQARLAALVADDTDAGVDAALTHRRIREATATAAATAGSGRRPLPGRETTRAATRPRISEPWFCCAEPTSCQLDAAGTGREPDGTAAQGR